MDNRYLVAGGVGALVVAVIAAAFFFLMPKAATIDEAGDPSFQSAIAIQPDDIGLGDPNAPIKLVEYASSGCGHCAAFHVNTMPEIKKNWVDTGQVYYVLRDYPLDNIAAGASLIARCLPKERFYAFVDILFRNQGYWHGPNVEKPLDALMELARRAGLSREQVESCMKDQAALARIQKSRDDATNLLKVNSTPTMFINGERIEGAAAYSEFDAKFKALQTPKP